MQFLVQRLSHLLYGEQCEQDEDSIHDCVACYFPYTFSMCYSFYKIGKNKGLDGGSQGRVDNQYCDRQTNEMSSNAITQNASYATSPLYIEGCRHTVYEDIQPR